jgi:DNA-binding transcriptional MerR regulator
MADVVKRSSQVGDSSPVTRTERLLTIGQVVTLLQPDFPDLSITKLRYLEDRGLLSPVRTKGRYRKYGQADVRRLRTILTLQRDDFLPLEVIRQRVEHSMPGGGSQVLGSTAVAGRAAPALKREEPAYSIDEVCETVGVKPQFVDTLLEYRLIDRASTAGPSFTESDLETVRICHLLTRFGVEPRHLRLLGSSTEREAAIVEQIVTPSLKSSHADKREYGEKMLADLGALFSQLLHLLLYKELRRLL